MLKKIISVLLAALLIFAAAACGKNTPADKAQPGSRIEKETASSAEKTQEESTEEKSTKESTKEESTKEESTKAEDSEAESTETTQTTDKETTGKETTGKETSGEESSSAESEKSEEETSSASTSEESTEEGTDPPAELHITDGLLIRYLVNRDNEVLPVNMVVHSSQESDPERAAGSPAYEIFEIVDPGVLEPQLMAMESGTHIQVTYITDAEGKDPLPIKPMEIVVLDEEPLSPEKRLEAMPVYRYMAELGYIELIDSEIYPTFLLMTLPEIWRDHPVTYEYSEDGRSLDVYYELKRDDGTDPVKITLVTFALSNIGDEPAGDIGYANMRERNVGPDYLYMGLPRYAFDYVNNNHDFYFYPEKGNWENEIKVTLTDEEMKTIIRLQAGLDDSEDYDALRSAYQKALEEDDTNAMTEVNHHLFKADEWLQEFADKNVSINGLMPAY